MEIFLTEKLENGTIKIIKKIENEEIDELTLKQVETNKYMIMTRDLLEKESHTIS